MRSRYEELQSVGRAGGSTKAALTCAFLRDYRLPLPAKVEQRDIAAAIATIDRKLAHHRAKRAALDALFQTTLHQLMTGQRSEEHTSELQSLMRISYAVFCLKKKKKQQTRTNYTRHNHPNTQTSTTNNNT